jgi:hypothetical protein
MNHVNNLLPIFNQQDNDTLCSDFYGNMAVGKMEYNETHDYWECVRLIGYRSRVLLREVVYWKFTSEIFGEI